jgi:hypothetical protein
MLNESQTINRRRYERFATLPMYTAVAVRSAERPGELLEGHAYDLSEGGIRFELDSVVSPGTAIEMRITMPRWLPASLDDAELDLEPPSVDVLANVIWIDDDDVPGPVRMAAVFTAFLDAADRDRLFGTLAAGTLRRAA